ncbi:VCBS domain-containing protein, partial [Vibrio parahaemolyticus]
LADFVPAGDTLTLVYTVTVTDSQGATSTQDITVTITGNNTPAVVWVATTESGSTGDWNDKSNWETGTVPTA